MYQATLNGKTTQALAYATLEEMYKGTPAIIKNISTGVEWFADQDCMAAQADRRIGVGEDPEGLVHLLCYPSDYEGGRPYGLSSSISPDDYRRGGYIEEYRTLAAVASGCWD